jgi:hypothetical protein
LTAPYNPSFLIKNTSSNTNENPFLQSNYDSIPNNSTTSEEQPELPSKFLKTQPIVKQKKHKFSKLLHKKPNVPKTPQFILKSAHSRNTMNPISSMLTDMETGIGLQHD